MHYISIYDDHACLCTQANFEPGIPEPNFTGYADGKPHTATRGTSSWTLNWYNRGLLKNETLNIDSHNFQLGYSYDNAGHRDAVTYPSGMQVNLAPDGRGRPTQLGIWANNINYAPNGRPSAITYGNGGSFSQTLNTRNLVAGTAYSAGGTPLTNRTLSWDANGNPTSISDAITTQAAKLLKPAQADWLSASPYSASPFFNGVMSVNTYSAGTDSRSFQYDNLDRMTRLASTHFGNDDYSYDALGNVRSRTFGTTSTYSYDATHNRVSSTPGHGSFSYDDRGNVTAAGSFTLTRNRANELTADSLGTSFGYDARGWRVKKHVTTGGTHTYYFIYDNKHRLMERWDNGTRTDFVYLGKKPIARITNNSPTYIFTDYQNSPLFETNSAGTVTRAPNFVGYGHPDTAGIAEIPGYTGAAPDSETGLLYLGARYLEAERFLSPDPADLDPTTPFGLNRYAYANDNPVRFTDPTGRSSCPGSSSRKCIQADTFEESRSTGQTTLASDEVAATMVRDKGVVAVRRGGQEEKIGFVLLAEGGGYRVKLSAGASTARTAKTDSATAIKPKAAVAVIHGHIDGRSDGVVSPADANPLRRNLPNGVVSEGRVGVTEISSGRLRFRMLEGAMTPHEWRTLQESLDKQQVQPAFILPESQ